MKKIILCLGIILCVLSLFACGVSDTDTSTDSTAADSPSSPTSSSNTTVETPIEDGKSYVGVLNQEFEAVLDGSASLGEALTEYEFFGDAGTVAMSINNKYQNRKWFILQADGTRKESSYQEVKKLGTIAAKVAKVADKNEITVKEITLKAVPKYSEITAKAGSYIMFDFLSSADARFNVTVTAKAGEKAAIYQETDIPIEKKADGSCVGLAKFTVPHTAGKTYYLNINMGDTVMASVPIKTVQSDYPTDICQLWLEGCWDKVKDPDYLDKIIYEFYSCFPQILARFAVKGDEPTAITVYIEDTEGVAWAAGNRIGIGLGWVNEQTTHKLSEIGFLSHELGHSAQQFAGKLNYGEDTQYDLNGDGKIDYKGEQVDGDEEWEAWFTEQMASYAGLRYYHWGTDPDAVDLEKLTPEHNYYFNWTGYGNCGVFFAYVDWHYPTIDKNKNGKVDEGERGVIDALYYKIKHTDKMLFDNPYDPNIPFNQTIFEATGGKYRNFPEIYEDFVADMKSGAWVFTGFSDYPDNWLSENIPGIENPVYPVYKKAVPGDVTGDAKLQNDVKADTVVLPEGENIAKGATVIQYSGKYNENEGVEALFDGDLETNWRALSSDRSGAYVLMELWHGFVIDLGEVKTFDTYAMVNAGIARQDNFNTASWEILVSKDGKNFVSIDYQKDQAADAVTVEVGTQEARYIEVRIHKTNKTDSGIVRINEMVFVKTK